MNGFIPVFWGTEMSQYKVAFTFRAESKPCGMAWCSKQFFSNEAAFGPNEQIVDQGRVGFGDASQFNPIASQGPVRVGGSLSPTLPFARLVVQTFTLEGSLFSTKPNKSFVFQQRLGEDFFPFDRLVWFLSSQPRFFVVQCSHYFW